MADPEAFENWLSRGGRERNEGIRFDLMRKPTADMLVERHGWHPDIALEHASVLACEELASRMGGLPVCRCGAIVTAPFRTKGAGHLMVTCRRCEDNDRAGQYADFGSAQERIDQMAMRYGERVAEELTKRSMSWSRR